MKRFDSKVVDLNEFRAARATRQQLDLLTAETGAPPEGPGEDRTLSGRDLAHRARMLAHLEAVRR